MVIQKSFKENFDKFKTYNGKNPTVIIANTIKGKGAKLIEGHGIWHHKIQMKKNMNYQSTK